MPLLAIYLIRASLIYLAIGFTLGGLLLSHKATGLFPSLWLVLPIHVEVLMFGWIIQFVMGVSFWILPRFSSGPARGNEKLMWASFLLLNSGIGLVCFNVFPGTPPLCGFLGRLLEVSAVGSYVRHAWPRIKPFAENLFRSQKS